MFGNRTAGQEFVRENSANTSSINGPFFRGVRIADAIDQMNDDDLLNRLNDGIESLTASIESEISSRQKLGDTKGVNIDFKRLQEIEKATRVLNDESKETVDKAKALNKLFDSLFDNIEDMDQQTRSIVSGLAKSNDVILDAAQTLTNEVGKKTATLGQTLSKSFSTFTNEMQNFVNTMNLKKLAFGEVSSVTSLRDMQSTVQQSLQVDKEGYRQVQNSILSQNANLESLGISMKDSMNYMSRMSEYQFENNKQAVALYKQVSIGTKYLGMSNQNMAAIVKAQNALADNSYMEKQLALLSALGTDDTVAEDLSGLAQWTSENITSIAARNQSPGKFITDTYAYQTVADKNLGPEATLLNNMITQLGRSTRFDQLSEDLQHVLNLTGRGSDIAYQMQTGTLDVNNVMQSVLKSISTKSTQESLSSLNLEEWKTLGATVGNQYSDFMGKVQNQYKAMGAFDLTTKAGRDAAEKQLADEQDTRTWFEKGIDKITSGIDGMPDGVTLTSVDQTVTGIYSILKAMAALQIAEAGSSVLNSIGRGGKGLINMLKGGEGAGAISGVKAWLGSSSLGGSLTSGGAAMSNLGTLGVVGGLGALGIGMGVAQANKTKDWKGGWARGLFLGTGNTENTTGGNAMSVFGNTAKYAAVGGAIGTIIPGVGTAIGAAVGGAAGLVTGLIGTKIDKQKEATDENTEAIKKNTTSTDKLAATSDGAITNSAFSAYYRAMVKDSEGAGGVDRGYKTSNIVYGESGAKTGKGGYPWSLSSDYGPRKHPITGESSFHTGIDLAVGQGTKIGSATDGKVQEVGYGSGVGNYTLIRGKNGKYYHYWHQVQKPPVSKGQNVVAGQLIGYVGSTGWSTGPHLHFQVNKSPWSGDMNPKPFVTGSIFKASGAEWDGKFSGKDWKDHSKSSGNSAASLMEALVDDQNSTIQSQGTAKYIAKETAFNTNKGKGGVDKLSVTPNYATSEDVNRLIQVITELNEAQNDQKSLLQALSGKNTFVFK